MKGSCAACPNINIITTMLQQSENDELNTQELNSENEDRLSIRGTSCNYTQWHGGHLIDIKATLFGAVQVLLKQVPNVKRHIYNMKHQANALQQQKNSLVAGEILLQIDFSENYEIRHQSEVMAAHWINDKGVTLYTAVTYFKEGDILAHRSYAVVSDTPNHSSAEVYHFNKIIVDDLKGRIPDLHFIHYWSDGAAQHFKNRFQFYILLFSHSVLYGLTFTIYVF